MIDLLKNLTLLDAVFLITGITVLLMICFEKWKVFELAKVYLNIGECRFCWGFWIGLILSLLPTVIFFDLSFLTVPFATGGFAFVLYCIAINE